VTRAVARLHVVALDAYHSTSPPPSVADAVRRLAGRRRVTAWSGTWSPGSLVTCDPVRAADPGADPFAVLADLPDVAPDPAYPDAVGGGWFGYLSFPATARAAFPRYSLAYYRDVLRHDGSRWWYEALLDDTFGPADAERRRADLRRLLRTPAGPRTARLEVLGRPDPTAHAVAVERCVQAIRRGEIYQANIACHVELQLHGSPHEAWARLVEAHAPARAGLVADTAGTAVSASPELFLHRRGRVVRCDPIKGTRPRTGDPGTPGDVGGDGERRSLRESAKDSAENVMIVDLMRNDLSRVCATGTVHVPRLLEIEPHPGVWHLVSTVQGQLAPGHDDADLLAATFPPGSVTGAPKRRAVEVIEQLEGGPRGLFTGALGFAGPLSGLELAVAIRTLEVGPGGRARLGVGGGVTVDSTPVEEWAECLTKAAPLLRTLGAGPLEPGPAWRGPGLARPASGVFETVLAVDGHPVRLADHVSRMRTSYAECFRRPLTADVAGAVTAAVAGRPGRLRVRVDAGPGDPHRVRVVVRPCDPVAPLDDQPGLTLRAHRLGPAGAERHKFADRRWLDALESAPGEEVLLVDDRDRLLEGTRSCVFAVRAGVLTTPPLDGRILPGTARRAVLDALDAIGCGYDLVAPTVADLARADAMFLVNAVRGLRWVRHAPGAQWAGPDPVTRLVARLLDPSMGSAGDEPPERGEPRGEPVA
jgi:para-aminobenzoate synthetase/4-amino-4-deoxychorismate lyase